MCVYKAIGIYNLRKIYMKLSKLYESLKTSAHICINILTQLFKKCNVLLILYNICTTLVLIINVIIKIKRYNTVDLFLIYSLF